MINTRTRSIKKIRPLEDKARTKNTLEYKANMCSYKRASKEIAISLQKFI